MSTSSTAPSGKYQLRTLHEEIGLFDRKLAHLLKYESFPTEADRDAAVNKLNSKRNLLVRSARKMADEGVEFSPSEVPASLRPADEIATPVPPPSAPVPSPVEPRSSTEEEFKAQLEGSLPSPYAGTALDCRLEVQAYKRTKAKQKTA